MSKGTCKKEKTEKAGSAKPQVPKQSVVQMQVVRPNAAGIDIGDTLHAVAVPPDRDMEPVRQFGAFTCMAKAVWDCEYRDGKHRSILETIVWVIDYEWF